ncbi:MAG: hypothetical protein JWQ09_1884 [Segetibacter sp.]|nr:hypothetical protein [Segetibacter sp.]
MTYFVRFCFGANLKAFLLVYQIYRIKNKIFFYFFILFQFEKILKANTGYQSNWTKNDSNKTLGVY